MNPTIRGTGETSATGVSTHPAAAREFRAPGRVNLIGEHTDYNDGFVMPAAIDFATWVQVDPRSDGVLAIRSDNFQETREFRLGGNGARRAGHWSDYAIGVAVVLERAGYVLRGANLRIRGNVPIGSGLSSSASLEVATAFALLAAAGITLERTRIARLCQQAENEFVGVRCGIMDQYIACCGRAGHALAIDCRSLASRLLPLPRGMQLVICDTRVHHALAGGEYNRRREECEAGVAILRRAIPSIRALRDVAPGDFAALEDTLPEPVRQRCRHVVTECARVERAAAALERDDVETFGRLMCESHASLRDDYEVSCPELDLMARLAMGVKGVAGARMTGGGFGGCTINLVRPEAVDEFRRSVAAGYRAATGIEAAIYVSSAMDGAGEVEAE